MSDQRDREAARRVAVLAGVIRETYPELSGETAADVARRLAEQAEAELLELELRASRRGAKSPATAAGEQKEAQDPAEEKDARQAESTEKLRRLNLQKILLMGVYRARSNPPILHRKETFLPPNDLRRHQFSELTSEEEKAGLYRDTTRIGHRLQW